VFPLSADPAAQRRALQTLRRSDAPSDIEEALRLATARVGKIAGAKIVLLSDGVFADVENFSAGQASLVYNKIGEERNNVAIEALGSTVGPEGRVVFCGVKNHALDEKTVTIDVLADGEVINSAKATIGSNKSWGNTFPSPPGTKVIEARITSNDILAADDYAATVIDPGASLRVLLVTPGDIFLERALSLDPRVTLDKAPKVPEAEQQGTAGPGNYDVVVFAGVQETPVKARAVLTFGQAGPSSNVTPIGRSQSFDFLRAEQHDLMRGVDLRNVYIENVEKVAPKAAGRVVAEGRTGPLIVVSETDKRQVYIAFSPLDSDFPLTVGFPIFVANALDFLAGNTVSDSFSILAGQQFQLPADTDEAATLERPDGGKMEIEPLQGRYIVRGVDQVGTYKLTAGEREVTVRANMRDDRESSVNAQDFVSIKKQQVQAVQDLRRYADFWKPLALLALCVLAVEWWMYARRS
jgi:Ca-activated chloride channel family protein